MATNPNHSAPLTTLPKTNLRSTNDEANPFELAKGKFRPTNSKENLSTRSVAPSVSKLRFNLAPSVSMNQVANSKVNLSTSVAAGITEKSKNKSDLKTKPDKPVKSRKQKLPKSGESEGPDAQSNQPNIRNARSKRRGSQQRSNKKKNPDLPPTEFDKEKHDIAPSIVASVLHVVAENNDAIAEEERLDADLPAEVLKPVDPGLPRHIEQMMKDCEKCRAGQYELVGRPQVWVRFRPPRQFDDNIFEVGLDQKTMKLLVSPEKPLRKKATKHRRGQKKQKKKYIFATDGILDSSTQVDVYSNTVSQVVERAVAGLNGVIVCLGTEMSGKSFSLYGHFAKFENRGIIPRALEHIFLLISDKCLEVDYTVRIGVIEIRRGRVRDLLTLAPYELPLVGGKWPKGMLLQQIGCAAHGLCLLIRALTVQQNIPRESFARYHTVVYIDLHGETLTLQDQPRIINSRITFAEVASIPEKVNNENDSIRDGENDNVSFEGFNEEDKCRQDNDKVSTFELAKPTNSNEDLTTQNVAPSVTKLKLRFNLAANVSINQLANSKVKLTTTIAAGITEKPENKSDLKAKPDKTVKSRRPAALSKTGEEWKPAKKRDTCCLYQAGPVGEANSVRRELSFLEQMLIQANEQRDSSFCNPWIQLPIKDAAGFPSQYFRQSKLSHCLQDIASSDSEVRIILHIRPEWEFLQVTYEAIRFLERAKSIPKDWRLKSQLYSCDMYPFDEELLLRELFISEGAQLPMIAPEVDNVQPVAVGELETGGEEEGEEFADETAYEKDDEGKETEVIPSAEASTTSITQKGKGPKTDKTKKRKDRKKQKREKRKAKGPASPEAPEEDTTDTEEEEVNSTILVRKEERNVPVTKDEAWQLFIKSEEGIALFEELSNVDNSFADGSHDQGEVLDNLSLLLSKLNFYQAELNFVQQERHLKAEEFDEVNPPILTNDEKEIQCHLQFLQLTHDEQVRHLKSIRTQLYMQERILGSRKEECEAAFQAFCLEQWGNTFPTDDQEVPTTMDPVTDQIPEAEEDTIAIEWFNNVKLKANEQAKQLLRFYSGRPPWNPY